MAFALLYLLRGLAVLALTALLGGCLYANYTVERMPEPDRSRAGAASGAESEAPRGMVPLQKNRLVYSLDPAYHADPPACAVVVPADDLSLRSPLGPEVDQAVAAHLSAKLERVMGPVQRKRQVDRLKIDLDHPGDQRMFARTTRCRGLMSWRLTAASETFLLAWSGRHVAIELELKRMDNGRVLWRAAHGVERSGGGLPLSPVGLVIDTVRAGSFHGDRDVIRSMVHDAVRRMMTTLPSSL